MLSSLNLLNTSPEKWEYNISDDISEDMVQILKYLEIASYFLQASVFPLVSLSYSQNIKVIKVIMVIPMGHEYRKGLCVTLHLQI